MDKDTLKAFLLDRKKTNFTVMPFKNKLNPSNGWAVPFVTGHKYRVHWAEGLDFETMQMEASDLWEKTDHNIEFVSNHTDVREAIEFWAGKEQILNKTHILDTPDLFETGHNYVQNDTATRMFSWVVNGKNEAKKKIVMKGIRCIGGCNKAVEKKKLGPAVYWSNVNSWPSKKLPVADETVEIAPGVNMIYDLKTPSPIFKLIVVNGALTFLQDDKTDLELRAYHIFVNVGALNIGTAEKPFKTKAQITLFGEQSSDTIVYAKAVEAGNKVISNTGSVQMFGAKRSRWSRLVAECEKDQTYIQVDKDLDWKAGDQIYLAPTGHDALYSDYAEITAYDAKSGKVDLKEGLKFYHFGTNESTASKYNGVDMRGEVILLTRNVRVVGDDNDAWGGQIVTSDTMNSEGGIQAGLLEMDSVEMYNVSQRNTYKAGLRFDAALTNKHFVNNSVIHQGLAWGLYIKSSANVQVKDTSIIGFIQTGVNIHAS